MGHWNGNGRYATAVEGKKNVGFGRSRLSEIQEQISGRATAMDVVRDGSGRPSNSA